MLILASDGTFFVWRVDMKGNMSLVYEEDADQCNYGLTFVSNIRVVRYTRDLRRNSTDMQKSIRYVDKSGMLMRPKGFV